MRERKLRAILKGENVFRKVWGIDFLELRVLVSISGSYEWRKWKVLSDYTGVNDKNGKEIFEGDIIKGRHVNGRFYVCEVKFDHGRFVMWWPRSKNVLEGGFGWSFYEDLRQIEIIGNRFENPELLGEKT